LEKEDNNSRRKDISTWFDQKFRIDRRSREIPPQKKIVKKSESRTSVVEFKDQTFAASQPEIADTIQEKNSPEFNYDYENESETINSSESSEMTNENSGITYIEELLEKIVFDPKELNKLKKSISNLTSGIIKPHQIKKLILKSYIRIFEELVEFIPFYFEQELNKRTINSELEAEIKEKDKFLEELGERINNIYLKLNERVQNGTNFDE
jgi:hypothetical protein